MKQTIKTSKIVKQIFHCDKSVTERKELGYTEEKEEEEEILATAEEKQKKEEVQRPPIHGCV